MLMTRLDAYLRAERPDLTEPPSFYVPGAHSWREAGFGRRKQPDGSVANEEKINEIPLDIEDTELGELAAVQAAAALSLEG